MFTPSECSFRMLFGAHTTGLCPLIAKSTVMRLPLCILASGINKTSDSHAMILFLWGNV
ncbi:hypothetical protein KBB05_00070 [Patescibacteria group bacterium]|nr:hypothetical protein [Patescibacteria group bacterium]